MTWIIIHYGYENGSGEYYITVDAKKCNGCGKCVEQCRQDALEMTTIMVNLEEKPIPAVREKQCREVKYICSPCKPESGRPPCVLACEQTAISCTWNLFNK